MRGVLSAMLLASFGLAATPRAGKADENNFLVHPVTTDLQRSAWGGDPSVRAYVLVNGKGLLEDPETVRWKALDFDSLAKALAPLRQGKDPVVIFHVFHEGGEKSAGHRLLRWALVGFGREARFQDARVIENFAGGFDWERHIAAINEKSQGQLDGDEPTVVDGSVAISPVRTFLSRHLYSGADCVVTLAMPFDGRSDGSLKPEWEKAIRAGVARLKLPNKGLLLFRVRFKEGGREAVDRFYHTAAKDLAEALDFKDRAMQSSLER